MPRRKAKTRSGSTVTGTPVGVRYDDIQPSFIQDRWTHHRTNHAWVPTDWAARQNLRARQLDHVSEYTRRVKRDLEMQRPAKGPVNPLAMEHNRLLVCQRRKARREVLHAKGHAGARITYKQRKRPSRTKC